MISNLFDTIILPIRYQYLVLYQVQVTISLILIVEEIFKAH